jgi:DNA helicase-4
MFCVGDDWQSIYRFTGSDIALFKDFKKYFGVTEQLKIETTYRFHNPLIDLSSKFIQKNPNQAKKDLLSANSKLSTHYQIRYSRNDDTETLVKIFNELIDAYDDIENKDILILAGHNRDLSDRVKNEDKVLSIKTGQRRTDGKRPDVNVSYQNNNIDGDLRRIKANFKTIHRSKGLEADIVIILRCNTEVLGIPNQMADDSVLNLLLSEADQFENGEERRLFYVAMTRAKEMLYFVTDSYKKSKFILEIETESGQGAQIKCPICKTGDININIGVAKKTGNRFMGYGCSNWRYKCPGKGMVFENQREWIEDDWIKSSQKNI